MPDSKPAWKREDHEIMGVTFNYEEAQAMRSLFKTDEWLTMFSILGGMQDVISATALGDPQSGNDALMRASGSYLTLKVLKDIPPTIIGWLDDYLASSE